MKQTLTLVCKLQPLENQVPQIEALLKAFADGCNYANQTVAPNITSKLSIQSLVYQDLRAYYGLSANQAVRVCARVGANRKVAKQKGKPVKSFKPTSADYDARIFAFREKDWTVSLTLLGGREHIPMRLGNYQLGKLKGRKPTAAQLCKHRDGLYYIHIQLTDETPEPIKANNVIGVDFGRRDIAVTSKGDKWDGQQITKVRDKYTRIRTSLQRKASKGTRSTRRRARQTLQRLSGRERRFQSTVNHGISKTIVQDALRFNASIAIEDLTGIRERTNQQPRNKTERRRSNSWAFYQLRQFLSYKGLQAGVEIIPVPPAYTSQTCYKCLHIGLRSNKRFKCGHCHWSGDADWNGSLMIQLLGQNVGLAVGPWLSCEIAGGLMKAAAF